MKKLIILSALFLTTVLGLTYSQSGDSETSETKKTTKFKLKSESQNNWSANLTFSDNGFGIGATKHFSLTRDLSFTAGIMFSGAKDDREFEQSDIFGNTITPFKVNRLFMFPVINLGMQYRLFRNDVTDNMRPFINFGVAPAAIVYTPYSESFFSSFKYAKAKYTIGGYAGIGIDYLSSKTSGLSFNLRYYYMHLLGDEGIQSISTNDIRNFGGIYFVFSYNFMK